jgi:GTP-binding protein
MFKIAIIGRPNVGKSTLFNKLVGKSFALVDDTPGVTRDRKEARAKLGPLEFMIIDTAGLENKISEKSLEKRMVEQTEIAVADADFCLFVVDGKSGVTNEDFYFAQWLKKIGKKCALIANKCENLNEEIFSKEYYKLGFGKPTAVSAEHKLGFGDLYEIIAPEIENYEKNFAELEEQKDDEKSDLQIAIVGRPNAGKSTFLNKILGDERLITGAEAGITRDAIAIDYEFMGQKIRFIDTAGIRKKSNIINKLEKLSVSDSFRAIRFAQIVILLIDANSLLDHQDLALAGEILKEGRGLIFAINKIDSVSGDKENFLREVRKQIQELLPEIEGSPILGVSAKTGYNVEKCLEFALKTYEQWQSHIPTNKLNDWLKIAEQTHSPKLFKGKTIKLKYVSQIKRRPPTFAVFTNHIKPLEGGYQRYLLNSLREYFDLKLTPIRLFLRKSENPFSERKEKTFSKKLHKSKK